MRNINFKKKIKRILKRIVKRGGTLLLCVFITASTIQMNALAAEDTLAAAPADTVQDGGDTSETTPEGLPGETPAQTDTPPKNPILDLTAVPPKHPQTVRPQTARPPAMTPPNQMLLRGLRGKIPT